MKLTIEINLDNSAFWDNWSGELSECLDQVNAKMGMDDEPAMGQIVIIDTNGNRVGYAAIK